MGTRNPFLAYPMMLAVLVVECIGIKTTGWDFLYDIPRILEEVPKL
jgi:hypothetical protein